MEDIDRYNARDGELFGGFHNFKKVKKELMNEQKKPRISRNISNYYIYVAKEKGESEKGRLLLNFSANC